MRRERSTHGAGHLREPAGRPGPAGSDLRPRARRVRRGSRLLSRACHGAAGGPSSISAAARGGCSGRCSTLAHHAGPGNRRVRSPASPGSRHGSPQTPCSARRREAGRLDVAAGDVRRPPVRGPFCPRRRRGCSAPPGRARGCGTHAQAVAERVEPAGQLVLDDIGPSGLPWRDLPMSVDWEREMDGKPVSAARSWSAERAPRACMSTTRPSRIRYDPMVR